MATADQIKNLIKAHNANDNERFKTIVLQIAAYEAKLNHTTFARELKNLVNQKHSKPTVLQFNQQQNNDMITARIPTSELKDLVASDDLRSRIIRILNEYKNRNKLKSHGLANRRKILIEGKPGTGKTFTAEIIASETRLPLYSVQMDKLVTKFMGETSIKLRQIFASIEDTPGVYLFDEFDAIGADRNLDNEVGEMRRILNSFLLFLEEDTSDSIIIAATNNPTILDTALFRRFDDVLHFTMPSSEDVKFLYNQKLAVFQKDFAPSPLLISKSDTLSHAEIIRICDDAIKSSILDSKRITESMLLALVEERLAVYAKRKA